MSEPQSERDSKAKKPTESRSAKQALSSNPGSSMDRFNTAMRKILSVPKKKLKDK